LPFSEGLFKISLVNMQVAPEKDFKGNVHSKSHIHNILVSICKTSARLSHSILQDKLWVQEKYQIIKLVLGIRK